MAFNKRLQDFKEAKPHLVKNSRHVRSKFRKSDEAKTFILRAKNFVSENAQNHSGIQGDAVLDFIKNCLFKICDEAKNSRNVIMFENCFGRLVNSHADGYGLFNVRNLTRGQKKQIQKLGELMEDIALIFYLERNEPEERKLPENHGCFAISNDLRADLLSVKVLIFITEE